jgi:hypothetical protein
MLARGLQAVMAPKPEVEAPKADKPEAEKPPTEQPSEAAPTTETAPAAQVPKPATSPKTEKPKATAKPKMEVPVPSMSLDAQWEEVKQDGNTFTVLTEPPQGGYWAYKILPDPPKPLEGKTLSVDRAGKVHLFKVNQGKAGSFLEFDITQADIPPAPKQ